MITLRPRLPACKASWLCPAIINFTPGCADLFCPGDTECRVLAAQDCLSYPELPAGFRRQRCFARRQALIPGGGCLYGAPETA